MTPEWTGPEGGQTLSGGRTRTLLESGRTPFQQVSSTPLMQIPKGIGRIGIVWMLGVGMVAAPVRSEPAREGWLKEMKALTDESETVQSLVKMSRLSLFVGRHTVKEQEKLKYFEDGVEFSERALRLNREDPGAKFWRISNRGSIAEMKKNLAALNEIKWMETELMSLRKAHRSYGQGASDRMLGALYMNAPRFISIGSKSKAEAYFRDLLRDFPKHPSNIGMWAKFLLLEKRTAEAEVALENLKKAMEDPHVEWGDFGPDEVEWRALLSDRVPK